MSQPKVMQLLADISQLQKLSIFSDPKNNRLSFELSYPLNYALAELLVPTLIQ